MKYYKAIEESTTDVNGAWKPLKSLSEGFEFVGDDLVHGFTYSCLYFSTCSAVD
jgi:hypothetical protein